MKAVIQRVKNARVDVDEKTVGETIRNGANLLVAGSSLYSKKDYKEAVARLREAANAAL